MPNVNPNTQAVQSASVPFPLTPALSLGERENHRLSQLTDQASSTRSELHVSPAKDRVLRFARASALPHHAAATRAPGTRNIRRGGREGRAPFAGEHVQRRLGPSSGEMAEGPGTVVAGQTGGHPEIRGRKSAAGNAHRLLYVPGSAGGGEGPDHANAGGSGRAQATAAAPLAWET